MERQQDRCDSITLTADEGGNECKNKIVITSDGGISL